MARIEPPRKVREGSIETADAARILAEFRGHVAQRAYDVRQLTSCEYALAAPLRMLDALHLAVASEVGESLVTADVRMAAAAKALRIRCRLIS